MILTSECFYNAISPACLAPYANMGKGNASNKRKRSAPKEYTKSKGQKKTKPNKTQKALYIQKTFGNK